jgi:hypothetical protein
MSHFSVSYASLSTMLEITGNDIAALKDDELRSLVGMLCESELRAHGLSTSAVKWGGDQSATDGGIDVCVKIEDGNAPGGYIPRKCVGFQCKKTDFTPGKIPSEMRPNGQIRESITKLIDSRGAYVIVSSDANSSDSAIRKRLKAMRDAVSDYRDHENLHLEFYDRNRIATWVRSYAGLIVWVRHKIGRSFSGWQSFTSWAASPQGIDDEYLIDNVARLHGETGDEDGLNCLRGINCIREILRRAGAVVRLVGLSGTGKTRFVQALFDRRVGDDQLAQTSVIYTDMSDAPSPQPTGMISDLIASRNHAIVVVDNCAPDLHRRIAELCRTPQSSVSVITIEYDVRDDEPEGTKVFRLEPSSLALVSRLIGRRYPEMKLPNVEKIAEFSGGNARIALALASGIDQHESLANLRDEELLRRLIQQRNEYDESLAKVAQACALLFSFQGESLTGDDAELPKLATLAGLKTEDFYTKVSQLQQRDLIQRRSVWRAILPQAVANRLAAKALREIPGELIMRQFNTTRLLRSYTRRIGYLHECEEAQSIASQWLSKDGYLAEVSRLNEFGITILENIAPISPELTLTAIERELAHLTETSSIRRHDLERICKILQSIAYDETLFDRCIIAMVFLACSEFPDQTKSIIKQIEELFYFYRSGTHATIEQRAAIVDYLLRSKKSAEQTLGLQLLETLLKADRFSPRHTFEFGARARDYGCLPRTRDELSHWWSITIQLARSFASASGESARRIREIIADSIQKNWFFGPIVQDQLEATADQIAESGYWHEGWLAVRFLLSTNHDQKDAAAVERLRNFEKHLRPKNTVEKVKAMVLSPQHLALDYADFNDENSVKNGAEYDPTLASCKANEVAYKLGKEVGCEPSIHESLLPDLVRDGATHAFSFGRGLAHHSTKRRRIWRQLKRAVSDTELSKRNVNIMIGFVHGLSEVDQALCENLLNKTVNDPTLGEWFPALQATVNVTELGLERLRQSIKLGRAQADAFRFLPLRSEIGPNDLSELALLLAKQTRGFGIAIEILAWRLSMEKDKTGNLSPLLIEAGRELLSAPDFNIHDNMYDYNLHTIANICLAGPAGATASTSLCKQIKQGIKDGTVSAYRHERLLSSLFQLQPRLALETFFEDPEDSVFAINAFNDPADDRRNPIDSASCEEILKWCGDNPVFRYPAISRVVSYYTSSKNTGIKWSGIALEILNRSPDPASILKIFVDRFYPKVFFGSQAAIIESRVVLIDQLIEEQNIDIHPLATNIRRKLEEDIARIRISENERDSQLDQRFE